MEETRPFSGRTPGTPMFDRLLLALDDSPAGEVATLFAAALARRTGATVHVLHVNEQLVGGNGVTLRSHQESIDLVSAAVRHFADAGVRPAGPSRVSSYRGVPQRIVTTALERSADAIVLGSMRNAGWAGCSRPGPGAHDAADRSARADRASTSQGDLFGGGGRLDGRSRSRPRFPAQVPTNKHAGNPQKPGRLALPAPVTAAHDFQVVMYSDLLTQALGNGEEGHRSDDLLLADLVDSRARLQVAGAAAPMAEALARELSYDGALIRLCESLEVRATPEWFDSPGASGRGWSASSAPRHPASRHPAPGRVAPHCHRVARRPPGRERPRPAPSVESGSVPGDDERMVDAGGREVRVSRPDKIYFPALEATKFDLVSYYLDVASTCSTPPAGGPPCCSASPTAPPASPSTKSASRRARPTGCSRPPCPPPTGRPPTPSSSPTSPTSCGP